MKLPVMSRLFVLVVVSAGALWGQEAHPSGLVFDGQRVTVTAGKLSEDGWPTGPAKVCLAPSGTCFTAPDNATIFGKNTPFGLSPHATVVELGANRQALLFTAVAAAGGSGSQKLLALLEIRKGRLEDLLGSLDKGPSAGMTISELSECKIWLEPTISKTALFVTADYVWGSGETHFSDHRYIIRTYDLGTAPGSDAQTYILRDEYMTQQKYPSEGGVDLLEREKPEVLARLRRQK
jgi:hypothetical protein